MTNIKRIILIGILCFSLLGAMFSVAPQRANAGVPVIDWAHIWTSISNFVKTVAQWAEEHWKEVLRDMVAKQLVDRLTDDVVRSIANEGDPMFVQDWESYLKDAGDVAFNEVNNFLDKNGLNLCSPFAPQIQLSLNYRLNYSYGRLPVSCRFEDFKRNLEFSENFIERGGWFAYDQLFLPSNNYYGLSMLVQDEYAKKVSAGVNAKVNEGLSGSGFLNTKRCIKFDDESLTTESVERMCELSAGNGGESQINTCVKNWEKNHCAQWEVLTPGDVASEAVAGAINSDAWWVTNVQSVVSAIVNVFVKKVFDSATGGLVGSSGSGGSGGNVTVDDDTQTTIDTYNDRRLDQIRDRYRDFIDYAANTIMPVLSAALDRAQALEECGDEMIEFEDDQENVVTMSVNEAISFLQLALQVTEQALAEAEFNASMIDGIDVSAPGVDVEILDVIDGYETFASTYSILIADLSLEEAGEQGGLSVLYSNMYQALGSVTCEP